MAMNDHRVVRRIMQVANSALNAPEFDEELTADALLLLSELVPVEGLSDAGVLAQDRPDVLSEAARYAEALHRRMEERLRELENNLDSWLYDGDNLMSAAT